MSVISNFARKISGRNVPVWQSIIRWLVFLGVAGIVAGALTFFALYRMIGIPDANADFQTQTTNVYYSDGKHKIGSFAMQDRENIPMSEIPASMQAAAVAAEDRSFYTNRGIDLKGIIRAARSNATSGATQGGSTITQQYVKVLYLTQERTIKRKIKEAVISIKIHNQMSKSEILEGYLNTIYFGNGAYGVEVASQTYFQHPASELTVPESAALAAIINSPNYYDPYSEGGKDRIMGRYNYVLDGMAKAGTLDSADLAKYQNHLPDFKAKKDINRNSGVRGFLLNAVKTELISKHSFAADQIDGGGYKIITTFDYKKQKAAKAAIKSIRPSGFKDVHESLVSIQPGTGAVRAMYGGDDFLKSEHNWALLGSQPGSSFKAFALIAALEDGYSLKTKLDGNSPIDTPGGGSVENEGEGGGQSFGSIPLTKATEHSVNTAFVDLTLQMDNGAQKIKDAAAAAGISDTTLSKIEAVPSVSLGVSPVPAIDMANAYATIAAEGKRSTWYMVESVKNANGDEEYKHKAESEQTIPKDVASDVIEALRDVVNTSGATGTNARTVCPTAGKTGTATAGKGQSQWVSSSWFVGFTPKLATAVMYNRGVGNERLDGYLPTYFGGQYPAKTFRAYMDDAVNPSDCGTFPKPANIKSTKGATYKPPPPKCKSDQHLNGNKTACIDNPTRTTPPPTTPPPTTPPTTPPTDPTPPTNEADCVARGGTWHTLPLPARCTGYS